MLDNWKKYQFFFYKIKTFLSKTKSKLASDAIVWEALTLDGSEPPSRCLAETLGPVCFFPFLRLQPYVWLDPDVRYAKLLSNSELIGCARFCNDPPCVSRSETESRLCRRRFEPGRQRELAITRRPSSVSSASTSWRSSCKLYKISFTKY